VRLIDGIARRFAIASMVWGVLGLAVGLALALELLLAPDLPPALSFGRLRPVHTGAVVFALVGNLVFAGIYHSSQRLLRVRIPHPRLAAAHFWSWQLCAAAAAVTVPLGFSQGRELAEAEWPIDVALAAAWLLFAINLAAMVRRRAEPRLYVSIWFYIATAIAVPLFHILNAGALAGGAADAMVQAWYGQMAVAFFLTAPVLGIVYDLAPRAAGRPLHSYRIAILHFWALVLVFGWAAPLPLLNTALDDWAQALAVSAGLVLFAPLLAGALNLLLTLRGTGARLRLDPVLKFVAVALFFHVLAVLEGVLQSTHMMSALVQYSDWRVGHIHLAALGLDGFVVAALLYWLVPRLWGTELRSRAAAGVHLYMASVGLLLYVSSMWLAGATQGVMWRAEDAAHRLRYTFIETALAIELPHWGRAVGGTLYLAGFLVMVVNLALTIRRGRAVDEELEVDAATPRRERVAALLLARPVLVAAGVLALVIAAGLANALAALGLLMVALFLGLAGVAASVLRDPATPPWHHRLETSGLALAILVGLGVSIGAVTELGPFLARTPAAGHRYSPLEIAGRDVYIAEGCAACHTQMVRPFLWEVSRYGEVSTGADSAEDRPALWGSRRIGPDLARAGGAHDSAWHVRHLIDPRTAAFASRMPSYRHLLDQRIAIAVSPAAQAIARASGAPPDSAMVALVAYLQRLGTRP
jgi:cytochrome c oxidase cbb3-type subunit I/II